MLVFGQFNHNYFKYYPISAMVSFCVLPSKLYENCVRFIIILHKIRFYSQWLVFKVYLFSECWHSDVGKMQSCGVRIRDENGDRDKWEWMDAMLCFNGFLMELKSSRDFIPMY